MCGRLHQVVAQGAERRRYPRRILERCRVDLAPAQEVELHAERIAVCAIFRQNRARDFRFDRQLSQQPIRFGELVANVGLPCGCDLSNRVDLPNRRVKIRDHRLELTRLQRHVMIFLGRGREPKQLPARQDHYDDNRQIRRSDPEHAS